MEDASRCCKTVCPSAEELSVIFNNVRCERCGLVFRNEPRYRMHDLKVHQRRNLDRAAKENVRYHCPVESCVYAPLSERHFSSMKYLKQHYLKVHAEKNYSCTRCNKGFSTEAAKEGHMRICGVKFTCSCSRSYASYEALLTHAKRALHIINEKYKKFLRRSNAKSMQIVLPSSVNLTGVKKPVTILPNQSNSKGSDSTMQKTTCDVGIQTNEYRRNRRGLSNSLSSPSKNSGNGNCYNGKRKMSKQTQTGSFSKVKHDGRSTETQTTIEALGVQMPLKIRKRRNSETSKHAEEALQKEDLNLGENFATANIFPNSPLPLRDDVGFQDFWEEKNTSGTQTLPEKDMFDVLNDNVTQTDFGSESLYDYATNPLMQCVPKSSVALMTLPYVEDTSTMVDNYSFSSANGISRSDPMLIDKTFRDKFSSIETQTEQAYAQSFFDSDSLSRSFALSSNIETQTTGTFDNMEQLIYSNTCTQTCNEILSSDLGLSNIQTQTAWTELEDTTVSAETQTKSFMCETTCNIALGTCRSWLSTQTSHTETQTDLLSIFEGLQ